MSKNNTIPPILNAVLQMHPAQQREWLAKQTAATRQNMLQLIAHHKSQIKEERWELKRQKRATQGVWHEAEAALNKANMACEIIHTQLTDALAKIFVSPELALQAIWQEAQKDAQAVEENLKVRPEIYGTVRGDDAGFFTLPTQFKAMAAAKELEFSRMWQIYAYAFQAKQYLEAKLMQEKPHGNA